MKKLFVLFGILMLLQSFQCEEKAEVTTSQQELLQLKTEILAYINTFTCDENIGCNYLAFGSKPCGGPWEYLVFSNAVDLEFLTQKVTEYNELENQFNIETGAASDCMFVMPPENLSCINNQCAITAP